VTTPYGSRAGSFWNNTGVSSHTIRWGRPTQAEQSSQQRVSRTVGHEKEEEAVYLVMRELLRRLEEPASS